MNFDDLKNEFPQLENVWDAIRAVSDDQPYFDVLDLLRESKEDISRVAAAIAIMVQRGELVCVYKIESPDGSLVGKKFDSLDEVPTDSVDSFAQPFKVDVDENVVPLYSIK